ncbi:MAG: glycoside hydrolase family 5 protein [Hyphomicrobiaceae bacterium]
MCGINLAGAEFGDIVPGEHGTDFMYPTAANVAYFADLGFSCLRVPFRWERLQPELGSPLDIAELDRLLGLVSEITSRGLTAIVDPHNYARRRIAADGWAAEHLIGSEHVPSEAFASFWRQLAIFLIDNERVALGLMNEPYGLSADHWLKIANGAIAAIRDIGAEQLLLVPGTRYSGAHSWLGAGNAAMSGVIDPLNHFAIEVHQYFDGNSSGTSSEVVSGSCGSERLQDFQTWAREHGLKAFLGEFGVPATPVGLNALSDICQEMSANPDVWIGWAAWSAGPFWPADYIFNLEPAAGGKIREQTRLLASYAKPIDPGVWVKPGAVLDLDLARERVHGCDSFSEVLEFSAERAPRTPQPGTINLKARLLDLLNRPQFSLLIEIEGSDGTPGNLEIIGGTAGPLLLRTSDGALATPLAPTVTTDPQMLHSWRQRRRCLLSADRPGARVGIAVTGTRSESLGISLPTFTGLHTSAGGGSGRIVRITAFDEFIASRPAEELIA